MSNLPIKTIQYIRLCDLLSDLNLSVDQRDTLEGVLDFELDCDLITLRDGCPDLYTRVDVITRVSNGAEYYTTEVKEIIDKFVVALSNLKEVSYIDCSPTRN